MLSNLRNLKNDMVDKGWTICSFLFRYKGKDYIVLMKRFVGDERRINDFALVKLHFLLKTDMKYELIVEANTSGLLIETKELRKYFEIEYSDNLGDILKQFSALLGSSIPCEVPQRNTEEEKQAMVYSLSLSDSEDPSKIYCMGVRRNPEGKTRSDFNSDKTKLIRKDLYNKLKADRNISFCYSSEYAKEKDDATILLSLNQNK
jgi:hypothetical protein